jgi:hypothetical protein
LKVKSKQEKKNPLLAAPDQAGYCVGTPDWGHLGVFPRFGAEHCANTFLCVLENAVSYGSTVFSHAEIFPRYVRFHRYSSYVKD